MPAHRTHAARQLLRFRDHARFPNDKYGQDLLIDAFLEACETDEAVTQTADYLQRTCEFCPVPANIYNAAEQVAQMNRYDNPENPFKDPGEYGKAIDDQMTAAEAAKWQRLAETAKNKWSKQVAEQMVKRYLERQKASCIQ